MAVRILPPIPFESITGNTRSLRPSIFITRQARQTQAKKAVSIHPTKVEGGESTSKRNRSSVESSVQFVVSRVELFAGPVKESFSGGVAQKGQIWPAGARHVQVQVQVQALTCGLRLRWPTKVGTVLFACNNAF